MSKNFYSITEAVDLLDVTRVTVSNWILSGKLSGAFKLSGEWKIPLSAIENMAKNSTEKALARSK